MASNPSNKEKTISSTLQMIPSDIWTIDNLQTYMNYNNTSILPESLVLDEFRDYFEQPGFLEEVTVDPKFFHSPAAFAEYYYGTPDLDFLVMYFAKITTLFEFTKKTIKVLSPERLKDVNKLMIAYKNKIVNSKKNPTIYKSF